MNNRAMWLLVLLVLFMTGCGGQEEVARYRAEEARAQADQATAHAFEAQAAAVQSLGEAIRAQAESPVEMQRLQLQAEAAQRRDWIVVIVALLLYSLGMTGLVVFVYLKTRQPAARRYFPQVDPNQVMPIDFFRVREPWQQG
jgi:hypothetical protein